MSKEESPLDSPRGSNSGSDSSNEASSENVNPRNQPEFESTGSHVTDSSSDESSLPTAPLNPSAGRKSASSDNNESGAPKSVGDVAKDLGRNLGSSAIEGTKAGEAVDNVRKAQATAQKVQAIASNVSSSVAKAVPILANPWTWIILLIITVLTFLALAVITSVQVFGPQDTDCRPNGSVAGTVTLPDNVDDLSIEERMDLAAQYFMSTPFAALGDKPMSKEQAAGAVGNLRQESGLDPAIVNSSSGAYGIVQWMGGRKTNLDAYAASINKDPSSFAAQVQFVKVELDNMESGQWGARLAAGEFPGATDVVTAVHAWEADYEVCGSCDLTNRENYADAWYKVSGTKASGDYSNGKNDTCQKEEGPSGEWVHPLGDKGPMNWTTYNGGGHENGDIDFHYNQLDDPIYAIHDGVVKSIGDGNCNPLIVMHDDIGYGSIYQHMNTITVEAGQTVKAGEQVGTAGTKGCGSNGVHLHFGIWKDGQFGQGVPSVQFMREKGVELGDCISPMCALAEG